MRRDLVTAPTVALSLVALVGCPRVRSSAFDPAEVWLPVGAVSWVDASADPLGAEVLRGFGAVAAQGGVRPGAGGVTVALDRVELGSSGEVLTWWSVTGADARPIVALDQVTTPSVGEEAAYAVGAAVGHHLVSVHTEVARRVYVGGPTGATGRAIHRAMRAGDTRGALVELDQVSEGALEPKWRARICHDEAVVWELEGQYARALAAERDAAALDPEHDRCVAALARIELTHRPLVSTDKGAPPEGW